MIGGDSGGIISYPVAVIETEKGEVLEVEVIKIQFEENKK